VSFYWAEFPVEYLDIVQNHSLADVKTLPKITLHHTQPQSLIDPEERDRFLRDYVSIVRCVAGGHGNFGFLRRDMDTRIHRDTEVAVSRDTFMEMNDAYIASWSEST
jgi:hypothetical protein